MAAPQRVARPPTSPGPGPAPADSQAAADAAAAAAAQKVAAAVQQMGAQQNTKTESGCLWSIDPFGKGGLFSNLLGHPSWCVLSKSQARAIAGASMLLLGGGVLLVGVILLQATLIGESPLGQIALNFVPGGRAVSAASKSTQRGTTKADVTEAA